MYYRHFKGKYYQTVAEALDTTSDEKVVIYRTLYPSEYEWFTRPLLEFHGEKELADGVRVKRFAEVEFSELPDEVQQFVKNCPAGTFQQPHDGCSD